MNPMLACPITRLFADQNNKDKHAGSRFSEREQEAENGRARCSAVQYRTVPNQ
jgi:hypothetical protein